MHLANLFFVAIIIYYFRTCADIIVLKLVLLLAAILSRVGTCE
jgi:hypothetical protein